MATFLANETNATDRDVTGPTEQVQNKFLLKDMIKILINNVGYYMAPSHKDWELPTSRI